MGLARGGGVALLGDPLWVEGGYAQPEGAFAHAPSPCTAHASQPKVMGGIEGCMGPWVCLKLGFKI